MRGRGQGNVRHFDKPARNDLHLIIKPVALVERAIRNSSEQRDTALDPFDGSDTTMIAVERTGRRAVLVEIDPRYVDVIVRRWQEATPEVAVLDGADRTFDNIATAETLAAAQPTLTGFLGKPHLDEGLVRHVPFVGLDLDPLEQARRQTQRDRLGGRLQVGEVHALRLAPVDMIGRVVALPIGSFLSLAGEQRNGLRLPGHSGSFPCGSCCEPRSPGSPYLRAEA